MVASLATFSDKIVVGFSCLLWLFVTVKGTIFILNSNPTSLSFQENWLFNMVLEYGLAKGFGFESPLCNLFPIC